MQFWGAQVTEGAHAEVRLSAEQREKPWLFKEPPAWTQVPALRCYLVEGKYNQTQARTAVARDDLEGDRLALLTAAARAGKLLGGPRLFLAAASSVARNPAGARSALAAAPDTAARHDPVGGRVSLTAVAARAAHDFVGPRFVLAAASDVARNATCASVVLVAVFRLRVVRRVRISVARYDSVRGESATLVAPLWLL